MIEDQELLRDIVGNQNFVALSRLCGGNRVKIPCEVTGRVCDDAQQERLQDAFRGCWIAIPPYLALINKELRTECREMRAAGKHIKDIATHYGVSVSTVKKWLK